MDITAPSGMMFDLINRVKAASDMCKISNIEKLLSESFDNLSGQNPVNYVGELNKNDVMH